MRTWIFMIVFVLAPSARADERTGVFVDPDLVMSHAKDHVVDRKRQHRGTFDEGWSHPLCAIRMSEIRFHSQLGAAVPAWRPFIDTSSTALVTVFDGH
jgi:hypothetical protein